MKHFSYRRVAVVTALVAASVTLGSASAASGYIHAEGGVRGNEVVAPTNQVTVHPDDRARHGREPVAPIRQVNVKATEAGGFDWLDAGIGAATVVGLGLIGAGGFLLVVRRRRAAAFS